MGNYAASFQHGLPKVSLQGGIVEGDVEEGAM